MRGRRLTQLVRVAGLATMVVVASASCGDVVRGGRGQSFLIIEKIEAASGATGNVGQTLASDVLTFVEQQIGGQTVRVPTVFEDTGTAQLKMFIKDIGNPGAPAGPTIINEVTITRFRVVYKRADGRNTPGVDVPYPFDGGVTQNVTNQGALIGPFTIVRVQAKLEAPLKALAGNGGATAIFTIAEVTFFGHDQAGNAVSVTGLISINFSDWGDPS